MLYTKDDIQKYAKDYKLDIKILIKEKLYMNKISNYMKAYIVNKNNNDIGTLLKSSKLTKKHFGDAGLDVYSAVDIIIPKRSSTLVSTNLYISVPYGCVGLLWSRSGLSVKHKIEVGAGCIDFGYTGEVVVHLYNHSDIDYQVHIGDRIAQLLTIPINLNNYEYVDTLNNSDRGDNGFGHTGK